MRSTVILSTYNRPAMLKRAIASVANQSEPTALIIVDDGSGVETVDICLDVEKHNPDRVMYLRTPAFTREEKRGWLSFCHAINIAQSYVVTPYVSYLCDDDEYALGRCKALADYLDANPLIGCVYGRQLLNGVEDAWKFRNFDHETTALNVMAINDRPLNPVNHNTFMHRVGFFANWSTDPDARQWIDHSAVKSLIEQGCKFQEIDVITGSYYEHDGNLSKGN